jgi:cell division septal protein FtsQ
MVEQDLRNMAKRKPLKSQEKKPDNRMRDARGAIPCLLLVIGMIFLLGLLFAAMLQSAK